MGFCHVLSQRKVIKLMDLNGYFEINRFWIKGCIHFIEYISRSYKDTLNYLFPFIFLNFIKMNVKSQGSAVFNSSIPPPIHHRVKKHCFIQVDYCDNDNNCLFLAMQATMVHAIRRLQPRKFYQYVHGQYGFKGCLRKEAMQLKENVNAPNHTIKEYDATIWIPKIIEHWNSKGNRIFKAFVYHSSG